MKQYSIKGHIVDVHQGQTFKGEVVIDQGRILAINKANNVPECFILPGLVDAHVHIESSMVAPSRFGVSAVRHGTVATVSDPHEIANVLGTEGIDFMIEDASKTPLKIFFGAPSCVPATPFEQSGATIDAAAVEKLLKRKDIWFLSEMMNFPGVIHDNDEVKKKLKAAGTNQKPIDGHAPGLSGKNLQKYIAQGISTDHECNSIEEAEEKIRLGMKIQIREGSAAKNFEQLYPLIDKYPDRVMLCTDDCHPDDLKKGHINLLLKRGIQKNVKMINLLRAATVNPVEHYRLPVGLLREGDPADICVVDSLEAFHVLQTFIDGELVYDHSNVNIKKTPVNKINHFNAREIQKADVVIPFKESPVKCIKAIDQDLYTNKMIIDPKVENSEIIADPEKDILKIVLVNRYTPQKPAVALIHGFGLTNGAVAASIAHDSHNIIAVGTNDENIVSAINGVILEKGGLVLHDGTQQEVLPLPIAGIMSDDTVENVAAKYELLNHKIQQLGCKLTAPFMTLSFMALLVIPELKIGDKGLFDVTKFAYTSMYDKS